MSDAFASFCTDNLMLLVGTNPLPNYVAARLLAGPATRVFWVVTDEMAAEQHHRHLAETLQMKEGWERRVLTVRSSDPEDIQAKVAALVRSERGTWALHYTGGKKIMSIHARLAMEAALRDAKRPEGVYSYLDGDTLAIVFEPAVTEARGARSLAAELPTPLTLERLLQLHGRPWQPNEPPQREPRQAVPAAALFEHCLNPDSRAAWLAWTASLPQDEKELKKSSAPIRVPAGVPVIGGQSLSDLAQAWGYKDRQVWKWLRGDWLEEHVLAVLQALQPSVGVHELAKGIKPQGLTRFEVDIAAIKNYQLFAVSVTTDAEIGLCKLKLFEILERARQMGGDEAQVALVCFSDKPGKLQAEVAEITGARSRVRVLGAEHLAALSDHFRAWFQQP